MSWKVLPLLFAFALSAQECGLSEPKCACYAQGCPNEKGAILSFDSLWWQAQTSGFSYALNEQNPLFTTADAGQSDGTLVRVPPGYDPGFRVGLGWNIDYDRWVLSGSWVWFTNHVKTVNVRSDLVDGSISAQGFYPQWPVASGTAYGPYRRVRGSYRILYNAIDLGFGRPFYMTRSLALNFTLGARGAWIRQKFFDEFTQPLQTGALPQKQSFDGKNNWWGVGPLTGLQSNWEMGKGFSFLGRAAGSLLYGKTITWFTTQFVASSSETFTPDRCFLDSIRMVVPNLQFFLGLGYKACYRCDSVYLEIDTGWEVNYYWSQFNFPVALRGYTAPLPTIGSQAVAMEGLTLSFRVDF